MIHPERNDVKIEKLFAWGKQFTIYGLYNKEQLDVHIRLVGDSDLNKSRTFAIRKSADMRKKLKTEDTDERVAFISSVYEIESKEDLIELITSLKIKDFAQDAYKEVKVDFPKEPKSDAKLEEIEKHQTLVDAFDEVRSTKINEYIFGKISEYRTQLEPKTIEQLKLDYEKLSINSICEQEMYKSFREHCVYSSCYRDEEYKIKLFESYDEFANLPSEVKEQFLDNYAMLEIDMDTLKKSLEAMP